MSVLSCQHVRLFYLRRHDHELLEGQASSSVGSAMVSLARKRLLSHLPSIENVHEGDREHIWLLGAGEVGDVCIERNLLLGIS